MSKFYHRIAVILWFNIKIILHALSIEIILLLVLKLWFNLINVFSVKFIIPKTNMLIITRFCRFFTSKSASITKIHRNIYPQHYLTKIVQPDGSSFTVRFNEPRMIIKLPLDINSLSDEERKRKIEARRPKQKVKVVEEFEDSFDRNKYLKYFKK